MTDYALILDDEGRIDIDFASGDIVPDEGLETAVLISLFSDARATEDQIPAIDRDGDLRGYWGDVRPQVAGDQTGSLLWVLKRAKQLNQTLADAREYAQKSLKWLMDDGIAQTVVVNTSYISRGWMLLEVVIYRPQSANPVTFRYALAWAAQLLKVHA
jgi:phage gp46-like protein